jgi:hypothetical protein
MVIDAQRSRAAMVTCMFSASKFVTATTAAACLLVAVMFARVFWR